MYYGGIDIEAIETVSLINKFLHTNNTFQEFIYKTLVLNLQ